MVLRLELQKNILWVGLDREVEENVNKAVGVFKSWESKLRKLVYQTPNMQSCLLYCATGRGIL
jgi:hypothetical protein